MSGNFSDSGVHLGAFSSFHQSRISWICWFAPEGDHTKHSYELNHNRCLLSHPPSYFSSSTPGSLHQLYCGPCLEIWSGKQTKQWCLTQVSLWVRSFSFLYIFVHRYENTFKGAGATGLYEDNMTCDLYSLGHCVRHNFSQTWMNLIPPCFLTYKMSGTKTRVKSSRMKYTSRYLFSCDLAHVFSHDTVRKTN